MKCPKVFNVPEFHSSEVTFFQNWYFRKKCSFDNETKLIFQKKSKLPLTSSLLAISKSNVEFKSLKLQQPILLYCHWIIFVHLSFHEIYLISNTARDEPTLNGKNPWTLRLYHGRWQKGVSAGGCRNNPDTFHMNPQLSINLSEADEVVLALNQHTATDPKVIGKNIYKSVIVTGADP